MRRHRRDTPGLRGEAIFVNDECFVARRDMRDRLAGAGYIEEVVDTLRSINAGNTEDVLKNDRTFSSGCRTLALLAKDSEERRLAVEKAGAAEVVKEGLAKKGVRAGEAC